MTDRSRSLDAGERGRELERRTVPTSGVNWRC
jgi:hypothetical protein